MKAQRNINIELLRILSIFFIIAGHIYGRCGLENLSSFATIAPHAVNCFVLISGYFLITAKFKFERVLRIMIETIFYTFSITLILFLFNKASLEDLCKSILPFAPTKFSYWFVNKYVALILLSPFIQKVCTSITKKQYQILLGSLLLLSSTLFIIFPFGALFGNGFSLIWFITLFITGGYLRLHYNGGVKNTNWGIGIIAGLIIYNLCATYLKGYINLGYNSIITYILAVCTFMWFKEINISNNGIIGKITAFTAPHVFAAYLIHVQVLLRNYLQVDLCRELSGYMPNGIYIYVFSMAVLMLAVIIDKGKCILFKKLKIEEITTKLSTHINKLYNEP